MMPDAKRKFRINAVAEMTGVPAATLRAWERRYGLPAPGRTESSYRLYNDDDVSMIRRLRSLCDEGMAPSEAAKMVLADAEQPAPAADLGFGDVYTPTVQAIVQAVADYAPHQLETMVQHATALGPATVVVDRVFRPAMREIGDRWHAGTFTIGQEHLASEVMENATRVLQRLVHREDATRQAVLACFADDDHSFPLLCIGVHLASWGFRVVTLGRRTPPAAVREAVAQLAPAIVGLSSTIDIEPHRARELVDAYAQACGHVPWVVGGSAAESMREAVERGGGQVIVDSEPNHLRTTLESTIARARGRATRPEPG